MQIAPCSPPTPGTLSRVEKVNAKKYSEDSVAVVCIDGVVCVGESLCAVLRFVNAGLPVSRQLNYRHMYSLMSGHGYKGSFHKGSWCARVYERELPLLGLPCKWREAELPINVRVVV